MPNQSIQVNHRRLPIMREAGTSSATNAELTSMSQPLLYQCVDLNHRASGTIREMQIKTTTRDLCRPDRVAILKTRQNKRQQVLARLRTAAVVHCCWECKTVSPLENSVKVPRKIKTKTTYDPGGISGKEPTCQCRRPKRHGFHPWVRKIAWWRA